MTDMSTAPPREFRYWDNPEPGPAALSLLPPGQLWDELQTLLDDGNVEAIEEWLATTEVAEAVKEVLRRGLRGEEVYDAVEAASLAWEDRTGSRTACLVRRTGEGLVYEVWQDGQLLAGAEVDQELSGPEILALMLRGSFGAEDDEALSSYLEGMARFEASSTFHDDLPDYEDWVAQLEIARHLGEGSLEGQDLSGRDFSGADLAGIHASRANLEAACFSWARLAGADLFSAFLRQADLRQADLQYAFLRGADLEGADLRGADLRKADLRFACLRQARLSGADLRGADLKCADTRGADFTGAVQDG